jgi:hypothetical protein
LARGLPPTPGTEIVVLSPIAGDPCDLTAQANLLGDDFTARVGLTADQVATELENDQPGSGITYQELLWVWGEQLWNYTEDFELAIAVGLNTGDWAEVIDIVNFELDPMNHWDPGGLDFAMNFAVTGVRKDGVPTVPGDAQYDQYLPYGTNIEGVYNNANACTYGTTIPPFPEDAIVISFTQDAVTGFDDSADCVVNYREHSTTSAVDVCLNALETYTRVQLDYAGEDEFSYFWTVTDISPAQDDPTTPDPVTPTEPETDEESATTPPIIRTGGVFKVK